MVNWVKVSKTVNSEGTTITYHALGIPYNIQSRKRHIPHANGSGTWDHTTYVVTTLQGKDVVTKYSLKDAKEWAEDPFNFMES